MTGGNGWSTRSTALRPSANASSTRNTSC
jgi:hypothetical protein